MSQAIIWLRQPLETAAGFAGILIATLVSGDDDTAVCELAGGALLYVKPEALISCTDADEYAWIVAGLGEVVDIRLPVV
jgi:hypothetical protein